MADGTDSELLYKQNDRIRPEQTEDCLVFVSGMLQEILPQEKLEKSFNPFDIRDAEDLVAYGLLKFDEKPPQENTNPHEAPVVVFYLNEQTKPFSANASKQSYSFFTRHVGLFDGYGANKKSNDRKALMVLSKDSYDGDVYRHAMGDSNYGNETRFLKVSSVISVMKHLKKNGVQSIRDLNNKYLQTRTMIIDRGSTLENADLAAKREIQSTYGLVA